MTETSDIFTERESAEATCTPELQEKRGKGTNSALFSQFSTQEASHKSSFDDLSELPARGLSAESLFSQLAFPTGKLSQKVTANRQKACCAPYQCLSEASATVALQHTANLRRVLETLEEDIETVDVRVAVQRKPPVTIGLPKTSTLFRMRKTR